MDAHNIDEVMYTQRYEKIAMLLDRVAHLAWLYISDINVCALVSVISLNYIYTMFSVLFFDLVAGDA